MSMVELRPLGKSIVAGLLTLRVGERRYRILPWHSILYGILSVLIVLALLAVIDRKLIPDAELKGTLAGPEWTRENDNIDFNIFRTDRATFREDEVWRSQGLPVSVHKRKASRILVMGDSFVHGAGNANLNDIWWRQLQRELVRRGYHDVEVIAAGWSGYSTHDQLRAARRLVPRYKPDLIIWGYVTNDPDEYILPLNKVPDDPGFAGFGAFLQNYFPNVHFLAKARHNSKRAKLLQNTGKNFVYEDWELVILRGRNFELYKRTVAELGGYIASTGLPQFVVSLPNRPDARYFSARNDPVQPLFKQAGISFYDVLPEFVARYPDATLSGGKVLAWGMNPANGHPGPRSTRFFAEKTGEILERDFARMLGKKSVSSRPDPVRVNDWMPYSLKLRRTAGGDLHMTWPLVDNRMPRMPIRQPYAQLNLEMPAAIKRVEVEGPALVGAELFYTSEDPVEHIDGGELHHAGSRAGGKVFWELEGQPGAKTVNTLRVVCRFNSYDRRWSMRLDPPAQLPVDGEKP